MLPIVVALGIIAWQCNKKKQRSSFENNDFLGSVEALREEMQACPAGLCDLPVGMSLNSDCRMCGFCFEKRDYLYENAESDPTVTVKRLKDTAEIEELESFRISAPIIIDTNGGISYEEFEIEPKTLEGLVNFAKIMHFAMLFNIYDGLSLDEGGFSLMMVDYWKLLGLGQMEAEDLVYDQGRFPESHESLLYEFWFKH